MTFIWATRGRTWGFRFLLDAGLEDPRTEYLRRFAGVENAITAYGRDGDVVVAYLFREGCAKLREKLERELRRGTLVCVGFELRGWRSSFEVAAGGLVARVYEVRGESSPV
mgnify:CR=1 FL=1